jgi:erythromycin esterase-like protein/predicted phosphoribosyltransferase
MTFRDRRDAGKELSKRLGAYADRDDVLVLALPRGGVPVGFEVARSLRAPLDVLVVRKLGMPGHEELAIGAIAANGVRVINEKLLEQADIDTTAVESVVERERLELDRREDLYGAGRHRPQIAGKIVIVVDDGLATGATMRAAVAVLRNLAPARVIVAAPVAVESACEALLAEADEVICAKTPQPFYGVGQWYADFTQVDDGQVRDLLARASEWQASSHPRDKPEYKEHKPRSQGGTDAVSLLQDFSLPLTGDPRDYDPLLNRTGDARLVLLGEASHGTHEFYRIRAEITRRLIAEHGFSVVAVEADWPDAYRVDRFVRGRSDDVDAEAALRGFERFPTWMWRNRDVVDFVTWLRVYNEGSGGGRNSVGFYGLDLYSLMASAGAVVSYLERNDPEAARRARRRYACFDHFEEDIQAYGYTANFDLSRSCEEAVIAQMVEMNRTAMERDGRGDEALFSAEQNARLVHNAEAYYRSMFRSRTESWNLRDRHMMQTLEALLAWRSQLRTKIVVWAHNSHLGDARATEMSRRGELNLGQLARQAYGSDAVLVGFSTYRGHVTAASDWDEPAQRKRVRPALPESYEALFHETGISRFQLGWDEVRLTEALSEPRLQRAIGMIYRPETERLSHYFRSQLTAQFDWLLHVDESTAVIPLEPGHRWSAGEPPESYPSGL